MVAANYVLKDEPVTVNVTLNDQNVHLKMAN
jgi:hypothetical protein